MKGALWINELGTNKGEGKVFCQNKRIYWDMFFKERTRFLFQNYDVVKKSVIRLTPSECRHNFDLNPKCLTWSCSDFESCPFVLDIVSVGKTVGKTEEELNKGSYWIRKAHNYDHSREILAEPSVRNESVSQYHKLEKKLNEDLSRMEELEDQLKRTIVKTHRCRIQEKIRNLRKLRKKTKTELEKVSYLKDRSDDECATHPYSKQIRQGEIRKAYALIVLWVYPGVLEELV